jgi:hypothetical protein
MTDFIGGITVRHLSVFLFDLDQIAGIDSEAA